MDEIRLLSKEDIEVRVAQTTTYNNVVKVSLLLYKNARVDMKIMDELFTPLGWRRTHKLIGDRLYCQVDVWDKEKGEWITKEDVGVESNTEAEKGQASDAFKRACVNWGIGRELYTAPKIVVELNEREFSREQQSGRIKVWASFEVGSIGYDARTRTITSLTILDKNGNERFALKGESTEPVKKARKTPRVEPVVDTIPYTPMAQKDYEKVVRAYAIGRRTLSGGDYKDTWIAMTHATEVEVNQFLQDVEDYKRTIRTR